MTQDKPLADAPAMSEPERPEEQPHAVETKAVDAEETPNAQGSATAAQEASNGPGNAPSTEDAASDATAEDALTTSAVPPIHDSAETPLPESAPKAPGMAQDIGFLGRRGTAPIRLKEPGAPEAPTTQPDAENAEHSAAANAGAPPASAPPAADAAKSDAATQKTAVTPAPADTPVRPGMAENTFLAMSYMAPLFLACLLFLHTAVGLALPSLFFPSEAAVAEVYEKMLLGGQWLTPPPTAALPAALPGYFWYLRAVECIPMDAAFFLPLSAGLSALLALWGAFALGRSVGLGKRISFAAGLILLSSLGFAPLAHWIGPELLTAGVLALALACLFRGWVKDFAPFWLCLGCLLAGLAALTGGVVALWIPLLGSIALILWRGSLRRGHRLDAVIGFGLLLLCVVGWLGVVILFGGESANTLAPLAAQLVAPFMPPLWPPRDVWWQALALLPVALLPWALVPFFVSWGRVLREAWPSIKASRTTHSGPAWLWICLGAGLLLFTISSHKPFLAIIPLLPLAAVLLAKALMGLSRGRSSAFYMLLVGPFLLLGIALTAMSFPVVTGMLQKQLGAALPFAVPALLFDMLGAAQGLPVLGGICLLAAVALYKLTDRGFPGGALTMVALFAIMLVQPASLLTGPSLVGVVGVELPRGMGMGLKPGMGISKPKTPAATHETAPMATPEPQVSDTPSPAENGEPAKPMDLNAPTPEATKEAGEAPVTPEAAPVAQEAEPPVPLASPVQENPASSDAPTQTAPTQ